jgi:cytochrome b561
MRARDSAAGWGWVTRALHWAMAGLILYQLWLGLRMVRLDDLLARFALTLGWRLASPRPPLPAAMPRWQRRAAAATHAALYALMLLLPVTGWLLASASPVQDLLQMQNLVFGRIALPDPFVPGSDALDRAFRTLHAGAAIALAALLAVHVAAALRHQFVDRDGLLARMLWR